MSLRRGDGGRGAQLKKIKSAVFLKKRRYHLASGLRPPGPGRAPGPPNASGGKAGAPQKTTFKNHGFLTFEEGFLLDFQKETIKFRGCPREHVDRLHAIFDPYHVNLEFLTSLPQENQMENM